MSWERLVLVLVVCLLMDGMSFLIQILKLNTDICFAAAVVVFSAFGLFFFKR